VSVIGLAVATVATVMAPSGATVDVEVRVAECDDETERLDVADNATEGGAVAVAVAAERGAASAASCRGCSSVHWNDDVARTTE